MKFAALIFVVLVLSGFETIKCSNGSADNSETVEANEMSTPSGDTVEDLSLDLIMTPVDNFNIHAGRAAPKVCTCNDDNEGPAASAVKGDIKDSSRVAPKEETTKTSKKTSGKKYRVITITLPEESETGAEIVGGGGGQDAIPRIVSTYVKDEEVATKEADTEENKATDNENKTIDKGVEKQQEETTSSKKSQKENKNKSDERTKKSGKYDNSKRSKRDTKGGSKSGQSKGKRLSKNKENKRVGGKNRK